MAWPFIVTGVKKAKANHAIKKARKEKMREEKALRDSLDYVIEGEGGPTPVPTFDEEPARPAPGLSFAKDPTPMEEEILQEKNRLPITVLETTDTGEIHFLYGNEAYKRFLHSVKIETLEAAQKRSNEQYLAENTAFLRLARRAEAAGRMQGELLINGVLFNTDIMFITREGDRAAFLTIVKELGQRSSEKQIQGISVAEEYLLGAYFRIDLFDENGTVVNLYLDADQRKLTDLDSDSVRLVRQYAERYICPEESESFCAFYDMDSILERVKQNGGHHVTKFFHSAIEGERGKLQNYTIIPFKVMQRWNYLSLCQYPEIPPREILEELIGME
jgi:hypothetical protein